MREDPQFICRAIAIANMAHGEQCDKAGVPYIYHPLRVMMSVETPSEKIAAVLHDVLEDTAVSMKFLKSAQLPDDAIEAVEALTHLPGEAYHDVYLKRVAANKIALKVKIADIVDNMNCKRMTKLPDKEVYHLMNKYTKALHYLSEKER